MARFADLVVWRPVSADDVIFVPAGTIHAIGAGLVIAELQQRSDATFRLFDYGRQRELHIENAIAVADAGPANFQVQPNQLTAERTLFISNPYFVFERIDLAPNSNWRLEAERETWLSRSRRQRLRRIVRRCRRRCHFRAIGPRRHPHRRHRYGGARGVHGRRSDSAPAAASHPAGLNRRQDRQRARMGQLLPLKQRSSQRTAAWRQLNETPSACGFHRELSSAPVRNRDIYPRSSSRGLDGTAAILRPALSP